MSFLTRSAAALALTALVLAASARAELVPIKSKRTFLASAADDVTATAAKDLFRETVFLRAKTGCIVLRFAGELSGVNKVPDFHVVASFELLVDDEQAISPTFHEAPTTAPRLVSIEGYACGLSGGFHEVRVRVRGENGDEVTVGRRTLDVTAGATPPA